METGIVVSIPRQRSSAYSVIPGTALQDNLFVPKMRAEKLKLQMIERCAGNASLLRGKWRWLLRGQTGKRTISQCLAGKRAGKARGVGFPLKLGG